VLLLLTVRKQEVWFWIGFVSVVCVFKVTSFKVPFALITTNSFIVLANALAETCSLLNLRVKDGHLQEVTLRSMRLPSNSMMFMPDLVVIYHLVEMEDFMILFYWRKRGYILGWRLQKDKLLLHYQ
jgi:hypothetical protein